MSLHRVKPGILKPTPFHSSVFPLRVDIPISNRMATALCVLSMYCVPWVSESFKSQQRFMLVLFSGSIFKSMNLTPQTRFSLLPSSTSGLESAISFVVNLFLNCVSSLSVYESFTNRVNCICTCMCVYAKPDPCPVSQSLSVTTHLFSESVNNLFRAKIRINLI